MDSVGDDRIEGVGCSTEECERPAEVDNQSVSLGNMGFSRQVMSTCEGRGEQMNSENVERGR